MSHVLPGTKDDDCLAIATKAGEYVVAPVRDMRPVCANCHLVIHRRTNPYSIQEVTEMLPADWFAAGAEDGEDGANDE